MAYKKKEKKTKTKSVHASEVNTELETAVAQLDVPAEEEATEPMAEATEQTSVFAEQQQQADEADVAKQTPETAEMQSLIFEVTYKQDAENNNMSMVYTTVAPTFTQFGSVKVEGAFGRLDLRETIGQQPIIESCRKNLQESDLTLAAHEGVLIKATEPQEWMTRDMVQTESAFNKRCLEAFRNVRNTAPAPPPPTENPRVRYENAPPPQQQQHPQQQGVYPPQQQQMQQQPDFYNDQFDPYSPEQQQPQAPPPQQDPRYVPAPRRQQQPRQGADPLSQHGNLQGQNPLGGYAPENNANHDPRFKQQQAQQMQYPNSPGVHT